MKLSEQELWKWLRREELERLLEVRKDALIHQKAVIHYEDLGTVLGGRLTLKWEFDGAPDRAATLINYMKAKIEQKDWHAVSDAANDLRVLEAQGEKCQTNK